MSTVKEELARLIEGQPDDSSREEIVRELAFHIMVQRGLADSDAKRTISNEEMAHRLPHEGRRKRGCSRRFSRLARHYAVPALNAA